MNDGRNIGAQVIAPDELIGAGKRFEVIKKDFQNNGRKDTQVIYKSQGIYSEKFSMRMNAKRHDCRYLL